MKKLFTSVLLAAAMMLAMPSEAQVKFGLKGGVNVTNMSFSSSDLDASNRTGFFIGPTVKFTLPIVGLGIDASALYDQREAKAKDEDGTYGSTLKQQAINIPINLRYGVGLGSLANLFLFAGPQFGFNVGDKNQKITDGETWKLRSSNFSINVGAGFTVLSHLQISANYNIACGKTGEYRDVSDATNVFKRRGRANAWQIAAAYYF